MAAHFFSSVSSLQRVVCFSCVHVLLLDIKSFEIKGLLWRPNRLPDKWVVPWPRKPPQRISASHGVLLDPWEVSLR